MGAILKSIANFITFGSIDRIEAYGVENKANRRQNEARDCLEYQKSQTQASFESLKNEKIEAYATDLKSFVEIYQYIGNVDLTPIKNLDGILTYKRFNAEYAQIKQISLSNKLVGLTAIGGPLAGGIAATGAYTLVNLLGVSSTGTAIGTLSGVAATNATLAWLGGGAVSVGGGGVGVGMVVLCGIAIAPLAVFGMFLGVQYGKQKLDAALEFSYKVDVVIEKIATLILELQKMEQAALLFQKTIITMESLMKELNKQCMEVVLRLQKRDVFHKYLIDPVKKIFSVRVLTPEEATLFKDYANCAYLLKKILDTPLLARNESFMGDTVQQLEKYALASNAYFQKYNVPQIR